MLVLGESEGWERWIFDLINFSITFFKVQSSSLNFINAIMWDFRLLKYRLFDFINCDYVHCSKIKIIDFFYNDFSVS